MKNNNMDLTKITKIKQRKCNSWKDFQDHGNATVEGQDLASTYVLRPCPRTGCPDFRMDWKGVMGRSVTERGVTEQGVTEQRSDGVEV